MPTLFYLKTRLKRGFAGGLSVMLIICALSWFSCIYSRFRERKLAEIDEAYDSINVSVVVSDLKGTATHGLWIYESLVDCFTSERYVYDGEVQPVAFSSYIKNPRVRSNLFYSLRSGDIFYTDLVVHGDGNTFSVEYDYTPKRTEAKQMDADYLLSGITSPDAAVEFEALTGTVISYFDGYDASLFAENGNFCIISEGYFSELKALMGLKDNEGSPFPIFLDIQNAPMGTGAEADALFVVGTYTGNSRTIYCPWSFAANVMRRLGQGLIAESMGADIQDNRKLDEFRTLLKRHFTDVDPSGERKEKPGSSINRYYDFAATVHDETLRGTLNDLNKNLLTLNRLLPFVTALELAITFAAGYFYINTRRRELAIARSLGTPRRSVMLMLLLEAALWGALGIGISIAVYMLTTPGTVPYLGAAAVGLSAIAGFVVSGAVNMGQKGIKSIKEVE